MTSDRGLPIIVIGGGIGGMSAALALARTGQSVHVLERNAEFAELGAGIQLAPNATRIFDSWGILPAVEEVSVHPSRGALLDADTGRLLTAIDFGERFLNHYGFPYIVLHRGDLLSILLSACQAQPSITLDSSKSAEEISQLDRSVVIRCRDGSTYEGVGVVAADGLWSHTRMLISNDDPIRSDMVAYRGALPTAEVEARVRTNEVVIWIGVGKHLVQYPVRRGEVYNQVAVIRTCHPDGADGIDEADELAQSFVACCDPVRSAVALIDRSRRWPMYDREPIDTWTKGRVTLLGDAAHPMLQYLAQGACQAIEDAETLAQALALRPGDIRKGFGEYQTARIPRTSRLQRLARSWGEVWHSDGVIIPLRNRVFAHRAHDDYSEIDWIYQRQNVPSRPGERPGAVTTGATRQRLEMTR